MSASSSSSFLSSDQQHGIRQRERYSKIRKKGDSLFGWVHLYVDLSSNNEAVAVKRSSLELLRQGKTRHGTVARENPVKEAYVLSLLQKKRICAPIVINPDTPSLFSSIPPSMGARFIVSLKDCFQDDKYLWIILQYAHGGDFFSYFQSSRRLSKPDTKFYFCQLLYGLRFIHSCGIAHLDLSFENLLMDERRQIVITDFGLCESLPVTQYNHHSSSSSSSSSSKSVVLIEQLFAAGPRAGKAVYLPPEIYTQQSFYGRSADVWSLGIMLFLCLAGADHVPFKKPLDTEPGFQWIISGRLRDLINAWKLSEYFDDDVIDLLNHLLCPMDRRYKSVEEIMNHRWIKDEVIQMAKLIAEEENDQSIIIKREENLKVINKALIENEMKKENNNDNNDNMKIDESPR